MQLEKTFQLCETTHIQPARRKFKVVESLVLGWATGLSMGFQAERTLRCLTESLEKCI